MQRRNPYRKAIAVFVAGSFAKSGAGIVKSSIDAYRAHYQDAYVPPGYSGRLHLAVVMIAGAALIGTIAWFYLGDASSRDWLAVPVTLVIASFVEYWAHRGPMHHLTPGLGALYERHTRRHHRFFVLGHMRYRDYRDFHVVLFPPVLIGFFGAIAATLGAMVGLLTTPAAGAIVTITSVAYYLSYELLHLSYHTDGLGSGWGRGWLAALSRHHHRHHDPQRMAHCNFNLVMPLFDWVFQTLDTTPIESSSGEAPRSQSDAV
jgi:hypothetical protein